MIVFRLIDLSCCVAASVDEAEKDLEYIEETAQQVGDGLGSQS